MLDLELVDSLLATADSERLHLASQGFAIEPADRAYAAVSTSHVKNYPGASADHPSVDACFRTEGATRGLDLGLTLAA
jgi:hypothetical protein